MLWILSEIFYYPGAGISCAGASRSGFQSLDNEPGRQGGSQLLVSVDCVDNVIADVFLGGWFKALHI